MAQILPQGDSDFRKIREEKMLYIDKTEKIATLEGDNSYITMLRPRRFGKSLFLSMLFHYYDIKSTDLFDSLFSGLYVHDNPTKKKNTYYVLTFDFSQMEIQTNSDIESVFRRMILDQLEEFVAYYAPDDLIQEYLGVLKSTDELSLILRRTLKNIAGLNGNVYVLNDEYEHFANRMIFAN